MAFLKKNPLKFSALDQLSQREHSGDWFSAHRRLAIWLAALWFVGCLLWGAPATLMSALLKPLAPQLELQVVEGSFWNGRASAAFWQQGDQRFALGSVEWQLRPWSLLWLHPTAKIAASYGEQLVETNVRFSPLGAIALRDLRATLPVGALAQRLPMRIDGLLGLKFERVEVARGGQLRELRGEVQWQRAASQWNSRMVALGDYTFRTSMQKNAQLQVEVEGKGALAATGNATLNLEQKNYTLQLQLTPAASLPQELRDGLVVLGGQRDAQGRWQVKRDGKW